jgi:uncharacterized damage-inducible protein DinB
MKKPKKKPTKKVNSKKTTVSKAKKKSSKNSLPTKAKKKSIKKATPVKATKKPVKQAPSKVIIGMLLKELEQEAKTTRKMLQRVPDDKYDWKPHVKSMTLQRLATHVAELPSWVSMAINTNELNFESNTYIPKLIKNNKELLELLEKSLADGKISLEKANDGILSRIWTMRNGDTILSKSTKGEVIRMAYCQIVHHRAQLGVYLRLLDIPLPGSYGPSADDQSF